MGYSPLRLSGGGQDEVLLNLRVGRVFCLMLPAHCLKFDFDIG
jgi:hypothetical protein